MNHTARTETARDLPGKFSGLFRWLTARAPTATVIVTGHPVPYDATALCLGGVQRANRVIVNETIGLLPGSRRR